MTTKEDIINHPDLLNIMHWTAIKLHVPVEDRDDLIQDVVLNILKGKIYEKISIIHNVVNHMRWKLMTGRSKVILARKVNLVTNWADSFDSDNNNYQYEDNDILEIRDLIESINLSEIEKQILQLYYFEYKTFAEVGKIVGKSLERIREIKNEIIEKYREKVSISCA